jgi:hypothetical protein
MKSKVTSPKEICWVQPFIAANKTKLTKKTKTTDAVTSQDFIKFWGKFFTFVLLEMIGNSQVFKTF